MMRTTSYEMAWEEIDEALDRDWDSDLDNDGWRAEFWRVVKEKPIPIVRKREMVRVNVDQTKVAWTPEEVRVYVEQMCCCHDSPPTEYMLDVLYGTLIGGK